MSEASRSAGPLPADGTAAIVVLASMLFAVSFGFSFGNGNHEIYLLPSMKLLDPELYTRDWTFTHATHYHHAFVYLGALLYSLDPRGWGVGLGLTVTVFGGTLALFALCRSLVGTRLGLPSFLLLVSVLMLTRTTGPGGAYVFDGLLQPSAVASALLLGAAAGFVAGRYKLSGVLLALSGLFHVNLLVLSAGAFGLSQLALGRERLVRRLLEQLGPVCLVMLPFLPLLFGSMQPGTDAKLAREIYLYVRAPHHFVLSDKVPDFLPLAGWALVAWGVARPFAGGDGGAPFRRAGACGLGFVTMIALGVGAALVSDGVRALFAWRVEPHAQVVLEATALAGAVRLATEPRQPTHFGWPRLVVIGVGLALVFAGWAARSRFGPIQVVAVIALGVGLLVVLDRSFARRQAWSAFRARRGPELVTAFAAIVLVAYAVRPLARLPRYSTLLHGLPATETTLFRFMRDHTAKSALFLTPPDLDGARLHARRAVVVDWRGTPAIPSETLAWFRRLADVTGRPRFRGAADLAGYDELDASRFERLRERYAFDYAVVRRPRAAALPGYEKRYENADFVVLRSPGGGSTIPPR